MKNNDMQWLEIKIDFDPQILEELSIDFFRLGCQGITEGDEYFSLFFEKELWTEEIKNEIMMILQSHDIIQNDFPEIKPIPMENWNEKWKENFKTFKVGDSILIKPDWEDSQPVHGHTVITIAPKMAFGTGHHETTQLILKMLEKKVKKGAAVLDAGTGSSILAIYAALQGAGKVVAFDNDPIAIENAHENCLLNKVSDSVLLVCGELEDIEPHKFDLIIANINRNVLETMAEKLKSYALQSAELILSGLLVTDRKDIVTLYSSAGWNLDTEQQQGEWISLKFKMDDKQLLS